MKPGKLEIKILGKIIGTCQEFDETNTAIIQFHVVTLNDLGRKWLLKTIDASTIYYSLYIDFNLGYVHLNEETIAVDWSVFNK